MKLIPQAFVCVVFLLAMAVVAVADGYPESNEPAVGQEGNTRESANYKKAKDLLPGELVVSPTGQRMKVWTTRGPVEVSKPPEPFADPEKTHIGDVHVVIDEEELRNRRHSELPHNSNTGESR